MNNCFIELMKLGKKWTGKIDFLSIVTWIPAVRPPRFERCYPVGCSRFVGRDYFFAGQCTYALIELIIISPHHSAYLPFTRTECRTRDQAFLTCKNWRKGIIKFQIPLRHDKLFTRNSAFSSLYNVFSRRNKHNKSIFEETKNPSIA